MHPAVARLGGNGAPPSGLLAGPLSRLGATGLPTAELEEAVTMGTPQPGTAPGPGGPADGPPAPPSSGGGPGHSRAGSGWTRKGKRKFVPGGLGGAGGAAGGLPGPPDLSGREVAADGLRASNPPVATDGAGPQSRPPEPEPDAAPRIDPACIPRPGYTFPGRPIQFTTDQGGTLPPRAMHDFVAEDSGSCNPRFMRATVNLVPTSAGVRDAAGVPIGVAVTPLATVGEAERRVQCVDPGEDGPARCHSCRAYMNPFADWKDGGAVWECNFCGADNEASVEYAGSLDYHGQRRDRHVHPEMSMGSVDYLAPPAFRPEGTAPRPVFVFAVEVTAASIRTGAADAAIDAAVACVKDLPAWPGARAGILCFGRRVHFPDATEGAVLGLVDAADIGRGTVAADLRRSAELALEGAHEHAPARHSAARTRAGAAANGSAGRGGGGGRGAVGRAASDAVNAAASALADTVQAAAAQAMDDGGGGDYGDDDDDDDDGFCGLGPNAWILPVGGRGAPQAEGEAADEVGTAARARFEEAAEHLRAIFVAPHRAALWREGSEPPPEEADDEEDHASPAPAACTGAALAAAVSALDEINGDPGAGGGRVVLFASSLPRLGMGSLPQRECGRMYGTAMEGSLVAGPKAGEGGILGGDATDPCEKVGYREASWWTKMAVKCADARVCVDTVVCTRRWIDIGVVERPSHATGGSVLHYPEFDGPLNHRQQAALAGVPLVHAGHRQGLSSPPKAGGPPPTPTGFGGPPPLPGGPPPLPGQAGAAGSAGPALALDTTAQGAAAEQEVDHGRAEDGATATLPAGGPFSLPSISTRVATELRHLLCSGELGWGCVLKVRASTGLRVGTFSCNAFPREGGSEADVACVGQDWTAMVALDFDGTTLQPDDELFVQAAMLWTDCSGVTRIRVHTLALRATPEVPDIFRHADAEAVMLFFAHQVARRSRELGAKAVTRALKDSLRELLVGYRQHCSRQSPLGQLILPESLKTLPLLCSSLMKSPALMINDEPLAADSTPDELLLARARCRASERVPALHRLRGMSPRQVVPFLYPRVLRLIDMDPDAGTVKGPELPGGRQHVALPDLVWPAADQLLAEGAWLVEWRDFVLIVVGASVPEDQCVALFGKPAAELKDTDEILEPPAGGSHSELNDKMWGIIDELTQQREGVDLPLGLVPPGSALRAVVESAMVEDRRDGGPSYADLLCEMHGQVHQHLKAASPYDL
ncbi:hypothetical protein FNF28_07663 [Cafeteria roenbergensis]|uniref:Protein transport protein SEC23 n=2 Tax=Cafeteria roenbergensis TaxID=33653 RepID=A0A5A8C0F5_CAFRO|nr:hypothetical protein FNF28_07663 [Cafeteria roenbergensis]